LDKEVGPQWTRRRVVEQPREQSCGQPEGWIRHHPVRFGLPFRRAEVAAHNLDLVEQAILPDFVMKLPSPDGVSLDRYNGGACLEEWKGQGTSAGADLDDQLAGMDTNGINEPVDLRSVNEEVLAEGPPSRIPRSPPSIGGHEPSPSHSWKRA
jgi:hypothetical protein